jgi:hypothetical protein
MKSNYQTLTEFAQEIQRREATKKDVLANALALKMVEDDETLSVGDEQYGINDFTHGQIATKFGIPRKYYDEMKDVPGLRAMNVNAWLRNAPEDKHLVRTLDGKARAFLSPQFKALDHYDVLNDSIFPNVEQYKNDIRVLSHSITDTRFYLQLAFPTLQAEVKKGDTVWYGLTITNSEVGRGALDVKSMIWRLVCQNGAIAESIFRKYHVGKKVSEEGNIHIYKNDTINAELKSYRLRLRDVIADALKGAIFEAIVDNMRGAAKDKIENLTPTVENVTKRFGIEMYKDKMIENIIREDNQTRWGIANSITALAHSIENPDKQYELEKLGNQIIELKSSEWNVLAA